MNIHHGLVALALLGCALAPARAAQAPAKPNIVFILADDLGYRDTGCFGSTAYKTPNIDALARRGMIFTQAYAANPLCSPSRASILTGQYPARIGITQAACHLPEVSLRETTQPGGPPDQKSLSNNSATRLSTNYVTLAETLKAAGYATGHFGKWHLGEEPYSPLQQGFDVDVPHTPGPGPGSTYLAPWQMGKDVNFPGEPGEHIEDRMAREAARFIEANKDRPFFLNYWSFSVHAPYDAKPSYVEQAALAMDEDLPQHNPVYAAMVRSLDDAVGALTRSLEANGLLDRTLIVFFSDNGGVNWQALKNESARRKNGANNLTEPYVKVPPTSNAPLRGGKASIYEGGTREPCFVVWPGVVPSGARTDAMILGTDFYPTLAEIVGASLPPEQIMDGRSFLPVLAGKSRTARDTIFNFFPHNVKVTGQRPAASVRHGDWKLICYFNDGPEQEDRFELYNLKDDLGESNDLAASRPEKVKELQPLLTQFFENTKAVIPGPNPKYDPLAGSRSATAPEKPASPPSAAQPLTAAQRAEIERANETKPELLRWKLRGCDGAVKDGVLTLTPIAKKHFVAFAPPDISGPFEIRLRARSAQGGAAKVEWLMTPDQTEPPSVPYTLPGGGWRDVSIAVPKTEKFRVFRIYMPLGNDVTDIDWIEIRTANGQPQRWDF